MEHYTGAEWFEKKYFDKLYFLNIFFSNYQYSTCICLFWAHTDYMTWSLGEIFDSWKISKIILNK